MRITKKTDRKACKWQRTIAASHGSALIWSILILTVITILLTGALAFANSYANRSLRNNTERQTYFTARTVTDAVIAVLNDQENQAGQALYAASAGKFEAERQRRQAAENELAELEERDPEEVDMSDYTVTVPLTDFSLSEQMGDIVKAKLVCDGETDGQYMVLSVWAKKQGKEQIIRTTIKKDSEYIPVGGGGSSGTELGKAIQQNGTLGNVAMVDNSMVDENGNIFYVVDEAVDKNGRLEIASDKSLMFEGSADGDIFVFVFPGKTLSLAGIDRSNPEQGDIFIVLGKDAKLELYPLESTGEALVNAFVLGPEGWIYLFSNATVKAWNMGWMMLVNTRYYSEESNKAFNIVGTMEWPQNPTYYPETILPWLKENVNFEGGSGGDVSWEEKIKGWQAVQYKQIKAKDW